MEKGVVSIAKRELHVISTEKQSPERLAEVTGAIHPFIDAIHIREKTKTARELLEMVTLLTEKQVPLSKIVINDRLDVAWMKRTKGIQLAHHSLPVKWVKKEYPCLRTGCSIHSAEEGIQAQQEGADYVIFGHIFSTSSKPGKPPQGLVRLKNVAQRLAIPVIAIGGIQPFHVEEVLQCGAAGIAVRSGILEAADPLAAARAYAGQLLE